MAGYTAFFDSCVLCPGPVADLLLRLAMSDLFRAKWSNTTHDEWIETVLHQRNDIAREQLEILRDRMNESVRDSLVVDFEKLIPALVLPDLRHRHVLAAAIRGRADVIVTYHRGHFPDDALASFSIETQHPDKFLVHQADLCLGAVCRAAKRVRASMEDPVCSPDDFLDTLKNHQLHETVELLRNNRKLI